MKYGKIFGVFQNFFCASKMRYGPPGIPKPLIGGNIKSLGIGFDTAGLRRRYIVCNEGCGPVGRRWVISSVGHAHYIR
jgi:hypothetical protein